MYRTDNSTNTASIPTPGAVGPNPDGFYQDTAGGGGTIVDADHLNAMQEELAYVVTNNGDTLSKTDRTQVDKAIRDIASNSTTYAGGESVTFPNGLIMKTGVSGTIGADGTGNVVFSSAFPSGIVSVIITGDTADTSTTGSRNVTAKSTTQFTINNGNASSAFYWQAIGY